MTQQIEIPLKNALGMKIEIDDTLENMNVAEYAIFDAIIEQLIIQKEQASQG